MTNGTEIFARYAYAPNRLGFCGPPEAVALRGGSDADVRAVARQFSGAWPYLWAMSRLTGISDPLDYRLVENASLEVQSGLLTLAYQQRVALAEWDRATGRYFQFSETGSRH